MGAGARGSVPVRLNPKTLRIRGHRMLNPKHWFRVRDLRSDVKVSDLGVPGLGSVIAVSIREKYSAGPSIRPICTRCYFTINDMIRLWSNCH